MDFESLAKRIDNLPLIICGPIVRHCHDKGITIWVALRKPVESVALSIFEDLNGLPQELVAFDTEATLRFGEHLHIATITATPVDDEKPLSWGKSYLYDLAFDSKKSSGFKSLKDSDVLKSIEEITYHEHNYKLPSIVLPPENVGKLRFIQCSCRESKGAGLDAMPALDDILLQNWSPGKRPQQLFLTGDQIYADEVDDGLLFLLTDAAKVLLAGNEDWEEQLPVAEQQDENEENSPAEEIKASDFGPNSRQKLVRESAMFTTKAGESHLLSLGEYFAMYLFIWSDVFWPELPKKSPESVPPNAEGVYADWQQRIEKAAQVRIAKIDSDLEQANKKASGDKEKKQLEQDANKRKQSLTKEKEKLITKTKSDYLDKKLKLLYFREGIKKIRRGLANISTYMVFDDHEVTDDWHLNREWADEVYKTPLGRRILQNSLAAFGVFQAWGNTPERYSSSSADLNPAGKQLLTAISQWVSGECAADNPALINIAKAVNIPQGSEIKEFLKKIKDGKIPQSEQAVKWYFSLNHPKYQTIFNDTRSQRALPGKRFQPAEHLSEEAIIEQIPLTKEPPEFTLLVSPSNLLTINYFRNWVGNYVLPAKAGVEGAISAVKGSFFDDIGRHNVLANDPDLADSWVSQSKAFENVISRLASRIPIKDGKRRTRLLVISGDVHFSATMRMQYWAKKPFRIYLDEPTKDNKANIPKDSPAEFVMAHLVCSAAKNEVGIFHYMHYLGYEVDDTLNTKENLPVPEIFLGYHKKDDLSEEKRSEILLNTRWFSQYRPSLLRQQPVLIPFHRRNKTMLFPSPDWHYRFDAIRGESLDRPKQDPQNVSSIFKKILPHLYYSKNKVPGLEIMSINNIAELDFSWSGEGKLTQPMSLADSQCELEIVKKFPKPPFQIIIDNEAMEVLEVEIIQPIIKFLKLRRKTDKTKAVDHSVGSKVTIRKTVNQNHWIVEKATKDNQNNDKPQSKFAQQSKKTVRIVVPMEFEDPFYQEPQIPLVETDTETEAT